MQTLITGSAELTGTVTDGYPALDVKAGIIFDVCMYECARESGGWGCQRARRECAE